MDVNKEIWLDYPDSSGNWLVKGCEGDLYDAEVKEGDINQVRVYGYSCPPHYCGDDWSHMLCHTGFFGLKWRKSL